MYKRQGEEVTGLSNVDVKKDGKTSWKDRVANDEAFGRVGEKRELFDLIKCRKLNYLGHGVRRT